MQKSAFFIGTGCKFQVLLLYSFALQTCFCKHIWMTENIPCCFETRSREPNSIISPGFINPRADAYRNSRADTDRNSRADAYRNARADTDQNPRADADRNPRADADWNPRAEVYWNLRADAVPFFLKNNLLFHPLLKDMFIVEILNKSPNLRM